MGFDFKAFAWAIVKPTLEGWLQARALVLPAAKVAAIAKKLGVTPEIVMAVDAEIVAEVTAAIEHFKP